MLVRDRLPVPKKMRRGLALRRHLKEARRSQLWGFREPEQTIPPEDEQFTTHAVWAIETYTPLDAQTLIGQLERLDLRDADWRRSGNLVDDLTRARRGPRGGSWFNLGTLFPRGSRVEPWGGTETDLPSGVRCARLMLHFLTSSVTALVVQFVFADECALSFDALARRVDFATDARIQREGIRIDPPSNVKQRELRKLRRELRDKAARWVAQELPGAFSSGLGSQPMPTAELVTTEQATPFDRTSDPFNYIDFSGFGENFEYWTAEELPGLRLTFDDDDRSVAVFAGRRADVLADDSYDLYGGHDERWALTHHVDEYVDRDLALWGTSHLLLAHQARLGEIRDQSLGGSTRPTPAIRRLKHVRDELLRDSLDARTVAAEVKRFASDSWAFERHALSWQSSRSTRNEGLLAALRGAIRTNAKAVESSEQLLREALLAESSIIGTLADLRIQRGLWLIGILALAIALVSLFVTLIFATDIL